VQGMEIEVLATHSQPLTPIKWENGWFIQIKGIQQFCNIRNMRKLLAHADDVIDPIQCKMSDDDLLAELAA